MHLKKKRLPTLEYNASQNIVNKIPMRDTTPCNFLSKPTSRKYKNSNNPTPSSIQTHARKNEISPPSTQAYKLSTKQVDKQKTLCVFFWNINGFNNLLHLDKENQNKILNADVMCLSVIWCYHDTLKTPIFLQNYNVFTS